MQILNFSLCIIEQLIFFIFFNTTFQKRFRTYIPTAAAVVIMSMISYFCGDMDLILKTLICISSLTICCHIFYTDKIYVHTAIVITILYIISIVDIIFGNLFSLIFSMQFLEVFYSKFSYRLVVCLIIKAVDIILIFMLHKFFSASGLDMEKHLWIMYNIVMMIFLFISMSFIHFYMDITHGNDDTAFFFVVSSSFLVMNLIVIYFFTKVCATFKYEKEVYKLESAYSKLQDIMLLQNKSSEMIKKVRHDMRNHLMTIKTLLGNREYQQAMRLLDELGTHIDSIKIELAKSTGNPLIDAVVIQNAAICESKRIKFSYDLSRLPQMEIKESDLSSVLSNLLTNAVEAAEKTDEPFIELQISIYKSYVSIAVKNSYRNAPVIDGELPVSSKPDKSSHGYGTQIISDIAEKYNGNFSFRTYNSFCLSSVLLNFCR